MGSICCSLFNPQTWHLLRNSANAVVFQTVINFLSGSEERSIQASLIKDKDPGPDLESAQTLGLTHLLFVLRACSFFWSVNLQTYYKSYRPACMHSLCMKVTV